MQRYFYTLTFYLLVPLLLVRLWWRGFKEPAYRQRWRERFGFGLPLTAPNLIWIHSVSVGETLAAVPLVRQLQITYPDKKILLTTMTPTGSERVTAAFGNSVIHCYLAYDLPLVMNKFLRHFNPEILLLMETELWPNLIAQCKQRKIPVVVTNARLSEKSLRGYQRFRSLSSEMLKGIFIAAQTADDAKRFIQLGADLEHTKVTGNIKYELVIEKSIPQQASGLREKIFPQDCPVWIAASTHQKEERQVLSIHRQLLKTIPTLRLIFVPRHTERFKAVADLCIEEGFQIVRRSDIRASISATEIFIGDSMGELLLFYAMADVAFVGGSLVASGGHNPLEPAAFACPVVVGPHTYNFHQITQQMIEHGAAVQTDEGEMALAISYWLENQHARNQAGQAGAKFVEQNRGTLIKLMEIITTLLKPTKEPQ